MTECRPLVSPAMSCRARTLPTTTGSTASRCEGFGCSERCTGRPATSMSVLVPRWYFTSPEPWTSSGLAPTPLNSEKTWVKAFFTTLTSTFSRPRWAMPIAISFTPALAALSMMVWIAGMVLSPPSRPKRLVETYLRAQKASKPSASVSCSRIWRLPALSKAVLQGAPSMCCWIQAFWSGAWMCMNSTPIGPQ